MEWNAHVKPDDRVNDLVGLGRTLGLEAVVTCEDDGFRLRWTKRDGALEIIVRENDYEVLRGKLRFTVRDPHSAEAMIRALFRTGR